MTYSVIQPPSLHYSILCGLRASPLSRVKSPVHGFEPRSINVGVDLRGGDIGVAKHGLHRSQIGAAFQQMSGKGMAQGVWRHPLIDAPGQSVTPQEFPKALARQRLSGTVGKDKWTRFSFEQSRSHFADISGQLFMSPFAEGHGSYLGALAFDR